MLRFYIDTLDTAAYDTAQNSGYVSRYDLPLLPFGLPWVVFAPVLALIGTESPAYMPIAIAGMAMSAVCGLAGCGFYMRRFWRHRKERLAELAGQP